MANSGYQFHGVLEEFLLQLDFGRGRLHAFNQLGAARDQIPRVRIDEGYFPFNAQGGPGRTGEGFFRNVHPCESIRSKAQLEHFLIH